MILYQLYQPEAFLMSEVPKERPVQPGEIVPLIFDAKDHSTWPLRVCSQGCHKQAGPLSTERCEECGRFLVDEQKVEDENRRLAGLPPLTRTEGMP